MPSPPHKQQSDRKFFARIKRSVVAIAYGHPSKADVIGRTTLPAEDLFEIAGTGFLVDRDRGLVLTARHVIDPWAAAMTTQQAGGEKAPDLLCLELLPPRLEPAESLAVRKRCTRNCLGSAITRMSHC